MMDVKVLRKNLKHPLSRREIINDWCQGKSVLDIGCVHHSIDNSELDNWLHKNIKEIADTVLGVDYLEEEVSLLAQRGYDVVMGDVNYPLPINRKFDVIVVGNLIEHLSSFSGLMENINRLLRDDGVALVSTANPFFREQYFYSALKNDIIVNPEHTCWIDPVTLDQLSNRFGMKTVEVLWVKEKWFLSDAYFNGERQSLDLYTGRWSFLAPRTLVEKAVSPLLSLLYRAVVPKERRMRIEVRYKNDVDRMLYLKMKGFILECWWRLRRLLIPHGDVNQHELFVSVLKRIKPL